MTRVEWFAPPANPAIKAAVLSENRRRGWTTVPGTMDQEGGYPMNGDHATGPLWVPNRCPLDVRTVAGPAHWGRLYAALGLVVTAAAILGWLV